MDSAEWARFKTLMDSALVDCLEVCRWIPWTERLKGQVGKSCVQTNACSIIQFLCRPDNCAHFTYWTWPHTRRSWGYGNLYPLHGNPPRSSNHPSSVERICGSRRFTAGDEDKVLPFCNCVLYHRIRHLLCFRMLCHDSPCGGIHHCDNSDYDCDQVVQTICACSRSWRTRDSSDYCVWIASSVGLSRVDPCDLV